ncbi:MAG: hypothetical protein WC485_00370 [Opitutaceae bacterium]
MTDERQTLPLNVDREQYDRILQSEAVAVSMYRGSSGMFSKLARIGTMAECEAYVNTPALLLVFDGNEYLGSEVVAVGDLLPPDGSDTEKARTP